MGRRRDERGIALPSPIAIISLAAVVVAGVTFIATGQDRDPVVDRARPVTAAASPSPSSPPATPENERPKVREKQGDEKAKKRREKTAKQRPRSEEQESRAPRKPQVHRGEIYVEVYNNSGITGLAGETAATIEGAGWQVVGSDNWYGTIPASTVYYPERLRRPARLLARDLGIGRLMPSISPMRFDRLTVILTSDYA